MATRRQILCATLVAPAFSVPTVASAATGLICVPTGNRPEWAHKVAAYRAARAAEEAHPYARTTPNDPEYPRVEAEHGAVLFTLCRTIDAVMECPVPDHAALVEKLEIMVKEFDPEGFTDCILADVRRLGGMEARP